MKRTVLGCVVAVCLLAASVVPGAQSKTEQMKDYSRVLIGYELSLTLVHLNDATAPLLFQPPMLYAMRTRARQTTMMYVQGRSARDLVFDTTNFRLDQGGKKVTAEPSNIENFAKGSAIKIPLGGKIDGLLVFPTLIDVSRPFTILHDRDLVEFKFSTGQVKGMTVAPVTQ